MVEFRFWFPLGFLSPLRGSEKISSNVVATEIRDVAYRNFHIQVAPVYTDSTSI